MRRAFDRIREYSHAIYLRFDELYDGPNADCSSSNDPR